MSSIILELQQGALDETVDIVSLLRKVFLVSTKLGLNELKTWANNELNGYKDNDAVPEYRKTKSELKSFNRFHGWIKVGFPDSEWEEKITLTSTSQSIAEIQRLQSSENTTLTQNLNGDRLRLLQEMIGTDNDLSLFIPVTSMDHIVSSVRNTILDWSLRLEQEGIVGEGIEFSGIEKERASMTTNIKIENFQGVLGWSSTGHWEQEVKEANEKYSPLFKELAAKPVEELAKDEAAMKIGQRLFANNCALCHGSTGRGALGFPNLTDSDWLYGGDPAKIKETITHGRAAQMPAKGLNAAMSKSDVSDLTHYLLSFSGRSDDTSAVEKGGKMFQTACAACHGADAKGNLSVGAPNLTDNVWLYGSTASKINQTITFGRAGVMPAQKDMLDEDKIHILTAYVYSLSNK